MRKTTLLLMLVAWIPQLNADEPNADRGKFTLEMPIKNLITASPNTIQPLLISPTDPPGSVTPRSPEYVPKARIESSTKRLVQRTAPVTSAAELKPAELPVALPTLRLPRLDVGKGFIERPVEGLLFTPNATPNRGAPTSAEPVADVNAEVVQAPTPDSKLDRRKKVIEGPVKTVVADIPKADIESSVEQTLSRQPTGDITKRKVIELPVTEIVADESADDEAPEPSLVFSEEVASDKKPVDENPHVEPGKVKWHASFDAAKEAAKESRKPVLLFHLMGQLDQRFT